MIKYKKLQLKITKYKVCKNKYVYIEYICLT